MRERGDYSRAEEYLEEIEEQIEFEYGQPFNKLPREAQTQAVLDHFFKGIGQYWDSANRLRVGMRAAGSTGGLPIRVSSIRGRRVIRDAKTGRFRQWVKE